MTDEELAKRLRRKDLQVFDYIMGEYNKLLWLVVGNILEKVGTAEDIEDCISDVYIKLLENPRIYDYTRGSLKSFLVRIAKNTAIDRYRKLTRTRTVEIHENYLDDEDDIIQLMIDRETRDKVLVAVDRLKEPDREILVRRYLYNERVRIISEKMDLPTKTIENRIYQAKLRLKNILLEGEWL